MDMDLGEMGVGKGLGSGRGGPALGTVLKFPRKYGKWRGTAKRRGGGKACLAVCASCEVCRNSQRPHLADVE